ncbi:hypothetical protein RugamoR57_06050 [Duganella caerulea]|uniref:hypothetical protein n=1 Tax=Duganella caerulea TaxID=2885762 RepID=UPI0030EAD9F2
MAIAWIREIRNHHTNGKIRIKMIDDGRHPSYNGVTYGKDDWMVIPPCRSADSPVVANPENMAVPWGYGGKQRLIIQVEVDGVKNTVSAEIRGNNAWDYVVLRDHELTEIGETEVGSLGDAPGVNHSWWALVLHANGRLEWHLFERQGLARDDLLTIVNGAGSFFIDMLPHVAGAVDVAAKLVPLLL